MEDSQVRPNGDTLPTTEELPAESCPVEEEAELLRQAQIASYTSPVIQRATIELGEGRDAGGNSLTDFLSYLSFDGHVVRFGLELTICFFVFTSVKYGIQFTSIAQEWQVLCAWFFSCTAVAAMDHLIFLRPYLTYQRVCSLEASGRPLEALALLESISPHRDALIRYPAERFHLRRASILLHHEHFEAAGLDLQLAREAGLRSDTYYLAMAELFRYQRRFEEARQELQRGRALAGDSAPYQLEEALTLFDEGSSVATVRRALEKTLLFPDSPFPAGGTTHSLANAYLSLLKLTSGHAEEGLEESQRHLPFLLSVATTTETLRPTISQLYLTRAHYYASHYLKELAELDLRVGAALSAIPARRAQAAQVKDEIAFRFKGEASQP